MILASDPPLAIDRSAARDLVVDVLSRPEYHRDDPTLVERIARWAVEQVTDLLDAARDATPGGWIGLVMLGVLLAIAVVAVIGRVGGVRRGAAAADPLLGSRVRTAAEHRDAAEQAAAEGRFAEAIRERLRAVARELEERAVIEPRVGRTADELVTEAGRLMPAAAQPLADAVRVFDEVWYGHREATSNGYDLVRRADELVRGVRPGAVGADA